MRRFKWIDWNLRKIDAHGLSSAEIEGAFDRVFLLRERRNASFEMFAETVAGRRIWVIWRYDREEGGVPDIFQDMEGAPIFVITAY